LYVVLSPSGIVNTLYTKMRICGKGGLECLINYLNGRNQEIDVDYTIYSYNNQSYNVYTDGSVTFANGTGLCRTGGLDCLYNFLASVSVANVTGTKAY
jgi:hypothetical protein